MRYKDKLNPRIRSRSGAVVVITGRICSGKSFISKIFKKYGFYVISSDKIVHDIINNNPEIILKIKTSFPEAITNEIIDKDKLANIVFFNEEKLRDLESILHPKVVKIRKKIISNLHNKGKKSIVIEIPLLYETNIKENFDLVISSLASPIHLLKRALARKGMTDHKFHAIYKRQSNNLVHIDKSDLLVQTEGTRLSTIKIIRKVIKNGRIKRNCTRYRDYRFRSQK